LYSWENNDCIPKNISSTTDLLAVQPMSMKMKFRCKLLILIVNERNPTNG
jgi:hypothetical protein